MAAKILMRTDGATQSVTAEDYDFIRRTIAHQLQHGVFERLDTNYMHGAVGSTPQISGAVFLSLHPKQLSILIADARISIILAVQRHLTNEQYRKRLAGEFHYRALKPHLSDDFRLLMVRPSNWHKHRFATGRKPNLPMAYQAEIERLEADLLAACQHRSLEALPGSFLRMRRYGP